PIIRDHLSEEGLLNLWDSSHGGRFEYPTLKHKSVLLAEQGHFERLPAIFERMRGICRGGTAEEGAEQHIALVRRRYLQLQ
ncbi:MAG TPA: hypothetical protein VE866_15030, partial [Candidatus Binatia bacterium]|nr:hypothetical protein [Candidatus Binatia bacterium]